MKTTIVIFGITGDLAGRKLLPALDTIVSNSDTSLRIVGVSRRQVDVEALLVKTPRLAPLTSVVTMDLANLADYEALKNELASDVTGTVLFYLSVPPGAAAGIVTLLGQAGLTEPRHRILFEKPFGYDLASAKDFIERTSEYFDEEQLYRIDHYMAKEIAAEVLRLRRNAENHHHSWGRQSVKRVTIVASEAIGIEGRGQFYEQTGALRDFIQGHLMQLLSLVLIAQPGSRPLPEERLAALTALEPANPERATRGQYEGYQEEVENPGSTTETFAAVELSSSDPNWAGVPLRLITGKALAEKRSYIHIEYHDGDDDIFEEGKVTAPDGRNLDAYERVLLEAIVGNDDIFTTSDEVIRSWEILAPVQAAWSMAEQGPALYTVGSQPLV